MTAALESVGMKISADKWADPCVSVSSPSYRNSTALRQLVGLLSD